MARVRFTLQEKIGKIDEARSLMRQGSSEREAIIAVGVKRGTLQGWLRSEDKIRAAASLSKRQRGSRARKKTVGGGGRRSKSHDIEGLLVTHVKDERREERVVTMGNIIAKAKELLPGFLEGSTPVAEEAWCARFMKRNRLTIRRVTHTGRKARADLALLQVGFVDIVVDALISIALDPIQRICTPRTLFNMDQTAIYANVGVDKTVDLVGVTTVPVTSGGSESYRCTLAITVCADGRVFIPHFVFKGVDGGNVSTEVNAFANDNEAVFSVQENAWFNERVMLEYVEKVWKYIVTEPSVLILDSLKVHKSEAVMNAFADLGTIVVHVPGGATGVAQPLDVGVMSPFKTAIKQRYTALYNKKGMRAPLTAPERRLDMYNRSMYALKTITSKTVVSSFRRAGPFVPEGPAFQ
jgi:hypothetical protein